MQDIIDELDWDSCVRHFKTTFDHYDVSQHTYDDDMHTDSVQAEVYYSSWCCTLMFSSALIYQYSRDNDLWSLIRIEVPYHEYKYLEFSPDLIDKRFSIVVNMNQNDMLSVVLTAEEHLVFTKRCRKEIPYGTIYQEMTQSDLWDAAKKVYFDSPDLLEAAKRTIYPKGVR